MQVLSSDGYRTTSLWDPEVDISIWVGEIIFMQLPFKASVK